MQSVYNGQRVDEVLSYSADWLFYFVSHQGPLLLSFPSDCLPVEILCALQLYQRTGAKEVENQLIAKQL